MPSVFTRIIRGELPCFKVHEDERVIAFLAREAVAPGHTLVVPKKEVDYWVDVESADYQAVFAAARPIGRALQQVTGCRKVGMAVVGIEVPHFHLHLIPLQGIGDLDFRKGKVRSEAEQTATLAQLKAALAGVERG